MHFNWLFQWIKSLRKSIKTPSILCEFIYGLTQKPKHTVHISWLPHSVYWRYIWRVSVQSQTDCWHDKTFAQMANQSQDIFKLTCVFETLADRLSPTLLSIHGYSERNSSFVARYHLPIQPSTKHWWFNKKGTARLFFSLPCQSCGGKTTHQFNTFSQVPQRKKTTTTKPHIYTDCTHFRWCIENKNKLVKQTEIVAKCIAIIWWLQQQTNK